MFRKWFDVSHLQELNLILWWIMLYNVLKYELICLYNSIFFISYLLNLKIVLHTFFVVWSVWLFDLFIGTPTMTLGGSNIDMDSISVLSSITAPHIYQCKCWVCVKHHKHCHLQYSISHLWQTTLKQHVCFMYILVKLKCHIWY